MDLVLVLTAALVILLGLSAVCRLVAQEERRKSRALIDILSISRNMLVASGHSEYSQLITSIDAALAKARGEQ